MQEQASMSTGGLFDLDAMQSTKSNESLAEHHSNPSTTPTKPTFALPALAEATTPVATPKAHVVPAQKGKLKIVKKKSPKLGAVKLTTNKMSELSLSDSKPQRENDVNKNLSPEQLPDPAQERERGKLDQSSAQPTDPEMATNGETRPDEVKVSGNADELIIEEEAPAWTASQNQPTREGKQRKEKQEVQGLKTESSPASAKEKPGKGCVESTRNNGDQSSTPKTSENSPVEVTSEAIAKPQGEDPTDSKIVEEKEKAKGMETEHLMQAEVNSSVSVAAGKAQLISKQVGVVSTPEQPDTSNEEATEPGTTAHASDSQQQEGKVGNPTMPTLAPSAHAGLDSDRVMQQFTAQLQRLEVNFETERNELKLQHQRNMEQVMAAKEEEMNQMRDTLKEKDHNIRELKRIKEGNELRMDSLKREVQGIKELLQERDDAIQKTKGAGKKEKGELEQKIRSMEIEQGKTKMDLKSLKEELQQARGKLDETNEEYSNLKSRVKVVACELKDRRAECRELKAKIEEMDDQNSNLMEQIANLDSQVSDRDRSGTEKEEEVNNLRVDIEALQRKLRAKEKCMEEQAEAHEKNLTSYKKKAQNSLSVANARAAAAIQSREEAELEARAARCTADATLERARIAEANGHKAMEEAKEYYMEMEQAKKEALQELEASKIDLESTKLSYSRLESKWVTLAVEKEKLDSDHVKQTRDIETERAKASNLQCKVAEAQRHVSVLQDDMRELRGQLQKAESMAAVPKKAPSAIISDTSSNPGPSLEDSTSKDTIMMLQKQLQEANQMNDELKEALENAVEMSSKPSGAAAGHLSPQRPEKGSIGAPLFYAMEKQAELNTARNEINRLASLYADVQSEKMEAQDELTAVRRELDEERAKLQRHEKLSSTGASFYGNSQDNGHQLTSCDPGRTNIEYLKNIMMSFLHAKTLTERKSLVPVIGAVLCLTPDEQAKAIQNIEASGGMEGFSTAFFETLGSKVLK